jgi:hypothetical protein
MHLLKLTLSSLHSAGEFGTAPHKGGKDVVSQGIRLQSHRGAYHSDALAVTH